jgi:hypothetical protein
MENFVLSLYGLWFWITRKYRATCYTEVAHTLNSARTYLSTDFAARASTSDRGALLPHQAEALTILERQADFVARTSHRFNSISECRKFVTEELTQPRKAA